MSREIPMLFNGEMVRAILRSESPKRQTRRPMSVTGYKSVRQFGRSDTPGYDWCFRRPDGCWCDLRHAELMERAPAHPGDTLWVRETWAELSPRDVDGGIISIDNGDRLVVARNGGPSLIVYRATTSVEFCDGDGFTGEFANKDDMPKWRPSIHMPRWAARTFLPVSSVRAERVCDITEADAIAEGFASREAFINTWLDIYGPNTDALTDWCWVIEWKEVRQ